MNQSADTAQLRFERMMRNVVAPSLQALGMKGTFREYRHRVGDYTAFISLQKSRWNSTDEVEFTFNLSAIYGPTETAFWSCHATELFPELDVFWWCVQPSTDESAYGALVARQLAEFGFVAIRALFDAPGYPVDRSKVWPRTFPHIDSLPKRQSGPDRHESRSWTDDQTIENLSDQKNPSYVRALFEINDRPSLWTRSTSMEVQRLLAGDPHPYVREWAARILGRMSSESFVDDALRECSRDDEDYVVRWSARYTSALRRNGTIAGR